jgi:hypothetical protein
MNSKPKQIKLAEENRENEIVKQNCEFARAKKPLGKFTKRWRGIGSLGRISCLKQKGGKRLQRNAYQIKAL